MTVRVGVVQTSPRFGRVASNLARALRLMATKPADLYVLPELFATGYQFSSHAEVARLSEPVPTGRTCRALIDVARRRRCVIVAGLPERAGRRVYNSAVVIGPDGYLGCYRKLHLFGEETRWFAPGRRAGAVWTIGALTIGVMVCFDWFFPETARSLALKGADVICHPANLVLPYCPEAMRTRSIENRLFTATANRVGTEARGGRPPLTYIGRSQITDPRGRLLFRASATGESVGVVRIDPSLARNKRLNSYNDLWEARKPAAYRTLTSAR
ncbi:MAG TPA: nitrilase-related carbon-nitrogen hydrolase [Nitrospiria bacterium]|nr:nitrilase-related carbon-nitrogen hydrolase [Nitrospiria bacterium]